MCEAQAAANNRASSNEPYTDGLGVARVRTGNGVVGGVLDRGVLSVVVVASTAGRFFKYVIGMTSPFVNCFTNMPNAFDIDDALMFYIC